MNIRKINPNSSITKPPPSRGSGVGAGLKPTNRANDQYNTLAGGENDRRVVVASPEYNSAGGGMSVMSGGSLGMRQLPDLKKVHSGARQGGNQTIQIDPSQNQKLRKASPEALALMMANMKKNNGGDA